MPLGHAAAATRGVNTWSTPAQPLLLLTCTCLAREPVQASTSAARNNPHVDSSSSLALVPLADEGGNVARLLRFNRLEPCQLLTQGRLLLLCLQWQVVQTVSPRMGLSLAASQLAGLAPILRLPAACPQHPTRKRQRHPSNYPQTAIKPTVPQTTATPYLLNLIIQASHPCPQIDHGAAVLVLAAGAAPQLLNVATHKMQGRQQLGDMPALLAWSLALAAAPRQGSAALQPKRHGNSNLRERCSAARRRSTHHHPALILNTSLHLFPISKTSPAGAVQRRQLALHALPLLPRQPAARQVDAAARQARLQLRNLLVNVLHCRGGAGGHTLEHSNASEDGAA